MRGSPIYRRTFGEIWPHLQIELVAGGIPQSDLQLLMWDGKKAQTASNLTLTYQSSNETRSSELVFGPPEIDATLLRAVRFPTTALEYSSEAELFNEVNGLIGLYSDLPEKLCYLLTYFVFATWFSDCNSVPISVFIMGPESRQGSQLFRLLSCLTRRPLLLNNINLPALCALPTELSPTLFLEQQELSRESEKFLNTSCARDTFIPWKGKLVNLSWDRVIRTEKPLNSSLLAATAIEVPVDPGDCSFTHLDSWTQQNIAARLQAKLLMYRLKNYHRALNSSATFPDLNPSLQEIACCFFRSAPDHFGLKESITFFLEEKNEHIQSESEMSLNTIVIDVMLSFCHQEGKQSVRVAEVANAANAMLKQLDEDMKLSPKAAGARLKALGLFTKRIDSMSRGIILAAATRRLLHKLAWGSRTVGARALPDCRYCQECVKLEEAQKLPWDPCKSLRELHPPDEEKQESTLQPEQLDSTSSPCVTPNLSAVPHQSTTPGSHSTPNPPSDDSDYPRQPRWVEEPRDQEMIDGFRKDSEL
jgi:hypothetical protein